MTLVAKPVIDKQFWILQDGDRKIGNVEACAGGYQVKIRNQIAQFKTIRMIAERANIEFESPIKHTKPKVSTNEVHGYPVKGRAYNAMWDVKHRLPVYTKNNKSKSWFAAGWYRVKKGRSWSVIQDPKMILLQRYDYQGPFTSEQQANDNSHTTIR